MTNEMLQTNHINTQGQSPSPRPLVAMEMSLKKWGVALALEGQPRKRVKTVAGGDYPVLLKAVEEARQRFGLGADAPVVFCYEAGRDGFYPCRRLTESGHEVWVIDSASIELSRRRRQAKSDGVDLDKLMELMQRKARGEAKALRIVRVPSPEAEDQRALSREREALMHDTQRLRNRIESALFAQGYRDAPKTAKDLKAWLESPAVVLGQPLRERLMRDVGRLDLLENQSRTVEKTLAARVRQEQVTSVAGVAQALMQLRGIGLIGAWVLASEIFGWRAFRNRREVGALLGLAPTPYSSGNDEREQGISKAGNARARSMLVELAWLWLRYQPESALSVWLKARFGGGGKRMRRIGIVALARRLAVALWRYSGPGILPTGAILKTTVAV